MTETEAGTVLDRLKAGETVVLAREDRTVEVKIRGRVYEKFAFFDANPSKGGRAECQLTWSEAVFWLTHYEVA